MPRHLSPVLATVLLSLSLSPAGCGGDGGGPLVDAAPIDATPGDVAPDYDRLFPADRIVDVDLAIAAADWDAMMVDPLVDLYVPATLTYDGVVVPNVAVRLKGNSSRNSVERMGSERYSFKVDLDEYVPGQRLLGLDKINFNNGFKDPSYLRERLATELYAGAGVPTSRSAYIRLTRNGEPFGLYLAVEQVEADWLRDRFGESDGNLYKPEIPAGDLAWRGTDIAAYTNLEIESDGDPTHAALLAFLDALNNAPAAERQARLDATFDVDGFLRYLAVTTALVNLDSYQGSAHNYYLYVQAATGKVVLLPWDTNEAFGNFSCGLSADALLALPHDAPFCGGATMRPLVTRVLAVPAWKARYQELLAEFLAGGFAPAAVAARVEALSTLIRADVAADPTRFFTTMDFETSLADDLVRPGPNGMTSTTFGLTSFVERRAAALATQLP
jgi:spore coat protein CotH